MFLLFTIGSDGCGQNDTFTVTSPNFPNAGGCYIPSYRFRSSHNFMYISYPTEDREQSNYLNVDTSNPEDGGEYILYFYGDDHSHISCTSTIYSPTESPVHIRVWEKCTSDGEVSDIYIGNNDISIKCGCTDIESEVDQEYLGRLGTELEEYMDMIETHFDESIEEDESIEDEEDAGKYSVGIPIEYPIGLGIFLFYAIAGIALIVMYAKHWHRRQGSFR